MAPKKNTAKNPEGDSASVTKKPAPKKPTPAEKKLGGVAKKPSPKKPVGKTSGAIRKETKKKSVKATGKAGTVIEEERTKPAGKSVTATTKKPRERPAKSAGKTSAAMKEPTPEPVGIPSEDSPAASPKCKRKTEDKWTESTDLPAPKSPKLGSGSSPRPSRKSKEIRTREEFASEGWDTRDFNSELCCIDTVDLSRIPSPFANLADRAERLINLIDNHAHPRVSRLFHDIHGKDTLSLFTGLDGHPPGAFVAVQHETTGVEFFEVQSDKPEFSLELKRGDETNTGVFFDIHIRKNARTDTIDYFVVNKKWKLFIVNEKVIGRNLAAGPLPNFAVIQLESWVIFWWRTREARDYIPETISQGGKEVEEGGATKEPSPPASTGKEGEAITKKPSPSPPSARKGGSTAMEPSPPKNTAKNGGDTAKAPSSPSTSGSEGGESADELPEPPLTWEDILDSNLVRHRAERGSVFSSSAPYQIEDYEGMTMENVLSAVATIWEALRNQGVTYAFAGNEVLDPLYRQVVTTSNFESLGVVGGKKNKFIMPLYFPPEQKEQDEYYKKLLEEKKKQKEAKTKDGKKNADAIGVPELLGHILLAVAEYDSAKADRVHIEIRDSRQCMDPREIRERMQEVAATWLGMAVDPTFTDVDVVRQSKNIHACGLLTILNAWAVMLDIPLLKREKRRKRSKNPEFLEVALEIVNLALAGFMDSRTIQAFLNVHGYSEEQNEIVYPEYTVDAVRMDPGRLIHKLRQQKAKDGGGELPSPSSLTISAHSPGSGGQATVTTVPTHLIQEFLDNAPAGTTLDQATKSLDAARGDVGEALVVFTENLSQLGEPAGAAAS